MQDNPETVGEAQDARLAFREEHVQAERLKGGARNLNRLTDVRYDELCVEVWAEVHPRSQASLKTIQRKMSIDLRGRANERLLTEFGGRVAEHNERSRANRARMYELCELAEIRPATALRVIHEGATGAQCDTFEVIATNAGVEHEITGDRTLRAGVRSELDVQILRCRVAEALR